MFGKIVMLFISAICLTVLSYWAYCYITDVPTVTAVEDGIVMSHQGKVGFVRLESGTVIESSAHGLSENTKVLVTVKKARRTGSITYSISKPSKILIAVDSESVDEDGNWK